MQCPKCQFENPEEAKFCGGCGAKLEKICPSCHSPNPPQFKFCGECGSQLTAPAAPTSKELSFDEKIEKLQRYLPKGLTEKILSQRNKIEGERKQVTVMFADMEGFTQLTDRLGPEEAYTVMDQVYEILIHKVHDYEGTVNEMTGDGIMALFGAPIALEDSPQRAIRSAYSIHREMTRFSEKLKQERGISAPVKMRIGIHTGPVVVGTLGNDLRVEFKAVGDTVNLASRMEGLAVPGSTYVSEDTFKLTEGFFRFEALGKKTVKGRQAPVPVYQVIAPSSRQTRFDVNAERGLTPFLGRQRELDLMLDAFERAKAGRGQALSIVAEAGLGKSRLLYEFRKAVSEQDVTFMEARCFSFSRGIAYHPVIEMLKSAFGIQEGDQDYAIKDKVRKGLKLLGVDENHSLPYILELLAVKDSGYDRSSLSPDGKKARIFETLNRLILKSAEIKLLVLAIEDLHWLDKSSEERFKDLLEIVPGARVFLIFTYRPESAPIWGVRSYHNQIVLNRLSNRESLAMAADLLGTSKIDQRLEELILEKTEGIPFFIEEFVKLLHDLKITETKDDMCCLGRDIMILSIPSTIQDVIMARVDALPEAAKKLLQFASAVDKEFSHQLLQRATGIPESEISARLRILKESELIYERGIYPDTTYIFKHALACQVIYDSLLSSQKKELHQTIGTAIEDLYANHLADHYGILVEHFMAARNYEKAAEYAKLAGRKAEKAASFGNAVEYLKKSVFCLEKMPPDTDSEMKLIDTRVTLALYFLQLTDFAAAKACVEPIIALTEKHNYKRRLAHINTVLGSYNAFVEEDFCKSLACYEEALKIGAECNDVLTLVVANSFMGTCMALNCRFAEAVSCLQKSLDINTAANVPWGISVSKANLATDAYFVQGRPDLAYQNAIEALAIADRSGDLYSRAHALLALGLSYFLQGFLEEAVVNLGEAVNLAEKCSISSFTARANSHLARVYEFMEEYKISRKLCERAVYLWQESREMPSAARAIQVKIAEISAKMGEKDIDMAAIFQCQTNNKWKYFEGFIQRSIASILFRIDDQHFVEAEKWVESAVKADCEYGLMLYLGMDYVTYADLLKRKNNVPKAREKLSNAIKIFRECRGDGWVEKYEKELAAL